VEINITLLLLRKFGYLIDKVVFQQRDDVIVLHRKCAPRFSFTINTNHLKMNNVFKSYFNLNKPL